MNVFLDGFSTLGKSYFLEQNNIEVFNFDYIDYADDDISKLDSLTEAFYYIISTMNHGSIPGGKLVDKSLLHNITEYILKAMIFDSFLEHQKIRNKYHDEVDFYELFKSRLKELDNYVSLFLTFCYNSPSFDRSYFLDNVFILVEVPLYDYHQWLTLSSNYNYKHFKNIISNFEYANIPFLKDRMLYYYNKIYKRLAKLSLSNCKTIDNPDKLLKVLKKLKVT